jgi:hypothetical protein
MANRTQTVAVAEMAVTAMQKKAESLQVAGQYGYAIAMRYGEVGARDFGAEVIVEKGGNFAGYWAIEHGLVAKVAKDSKTELFHPHGMAGTKEFYICVGAIGPDAGIAQQIVSAGLSKASGNEEAA